MVEAQLSEGIVIKKTVIFTLVLVAIALGAYLLLPLWSTPLLKSVLANYDVRIDSLVLQRPSADRFTIYELDLYYPADNPQLRLRAPELRIAYKPADLVHGRLESIAIPKLKIESLSSAATKNDAAASPFKPPAPAVLFELIPANTLDIDLLQLETQLPAPWSQLSGYFYFNGYFNEAQATLSVENNTGTAMELAITPASDIKVSVRQQRELLLHLDSRIEDNELLGTVDVHVRPLVELLETLELMPEPLTLAGNIQGRFSTPLPKNLTAAAIKQLTAAGEINGTLDIGHPQADLNTTIALDSDFDLQDQKITLSPDRFTVDAAISKQPSAQLAVQIEQAAIDFKQSWQVAAAFSSKLNAADQRAEGGDNALQFQSIAAHLSGDLLATPDQSHLTLAPNASLQVTDISAPELQVPSLAITSQQPINILYKNDALEINNALLYAQAMEVVSGGNRYVVSGIQASLSGIKAGIKAAAAANPQQFGELSGKAELELMDLSIASNLLPTGWQLKPQNLNLVMQIDGPELDAALTGNGPGQLLDITAQVSHNLGSGAGSIEARLSSATFNQEQVFLPAIFDAWPLPLDFSSGRIQNDLAMSWNDSGLQGEMAITLDNLGGFYQRTLFDGINGKLQLADLTDALKMQSSGISIATVNPGFDITNIEFSLSYEQGQLLIKNLNAELLGGQVSQNLIQLDPTREQNRLSLNLHDIQLDQVLELQADIQGQGSLSGNLPLTLSAGEITVDKAKLSSSDEGGVIRYQGEQSLAQAGGMGLELALDALNNFHFELLDVEADYADNGDLALAIRLEGRNPDMESSRPVHFNLNINQNLLALLKSLQFSQEINDKISRRIQQVQD